MALQWHAVAECQHTGCEWRFEARDVMAAFNEGAAVEAHERKTKKDEGKAHAAHQRLHRTDYCSQLGCAEVPS